MALLLEVYAPFDSGPGANAMESTWRDMMKHMLGSASGVIKGFDNDFAATGDSSGMQVKVATGQAWMRGHFGKSTAIKVLPVAAAHATLARKDIVVIRADFVDNEIEVDVITGTAAASPTAPTVTQNTSVWETLLAVVDVPAAAVTITAGNVVNTRVYTSAFAKYSRSTAQSPIGDSTFVDVAYDTTSVPTGDVTMNTAGSQFTLNRAGLWQITAQHGFSPPASGLSGGRSVQITDVSNAPYSETTVGSVADAAINTYVLTQASERFALGAVVKIRSWQKSGTSLSLIAGTPKVALMWVGP